LANAIAILTDVANNYQILIQINILFHYKTTKKQ